MVEEQRKEYQNQGKRDIEENKDLGMTGEPQTEQTQGEKFGGERISGEELDEDKV